MDFVYTIRKVNKYLCLDQYGNVEVKDGEKYVIRRPFATKQEKENNTKDKQDNHPNNKNNPFIKFCQEYRSTHPGGKVKVETISEQWKQLDEKTKREKYGYNATTTNLKKEEKNNNNGHEDNKRKRNDDEEHQNKTTKRGRLKKDNDARKLSSKKEEMDNHYQYKEMTDKIFLDILICYFFDPII